MPEDAFNIILSWKIYLIINCYAHTFELYKRENIIQIIIRAL
jgi:hypothetical protein